MVILLQGMGTLRMLADNAAWMGGVSDDTFISQISIPGTHDAGTGHGVNNAYVIVSGKTYAVTQEKTLTEQWNSGIRAFDLRPAVDGSRLRIYHGLISTNLYFDDALTTLCGLLDSHPTETCIIFIRHESEGDDNNDSWGTKMKELLNSNPTKSHAVNFNPDAKLGDMRGKLLILCRDNYGTNPVGGYISGWGFNPNFANQQGAKINGIGTQGPLYVQDFYDVSASDAPATKSASIQRMLQFSCTENTNPSLWVVNQTSGYSKTASIFGNTVATSDGYRDNAATQNPVVIDYLNSHTGSTGIVLMDYAAEDVSGNYQVKGQALTDAIIANNFKESPHADYFRALASITPGNKYVVSTTVGDTKYYLTTRGLLTADASGASIFSFSRVEGAAYTYGFNLQNAYFTSPQVSSGSVVYNSGRLRTNMSSKRKDWEAQVFFMDSEGKYAVRATNAKGTGNQEAASQAFWTVNTGDEGPVAEYASDMQYIWEIENTINVTYNLYFGGEKCGEAIVPGELSTAAALPEAYIRDFCNYAYSPKNITSTSIKVTVTWAGSAPFKISSDTDTWYNLKAGCLGRYVGWEGREPYHPHAYDEASVGEYPEEELYATDLVRASDAYQWAFKGNPIEGFKIVNKLMGEDYSLTVDGTATSVQGVSDIKNTVLREGDFRWTVHANNDGFSLSLMDQKDYYVNTHGGPHGYLQVWESENAKTDLGSQIIAETVPTAPVTLTPIGEGFYTTLCFPYDVTVGDAKVYILEKGEDAISEGYVLLTNVGNAVPAGTPVVLWGESETASLTYGEGFTAQPSTATALQGLFMPASPTNVLTLQGQNDIPGFYAPTDETIEPNQAYLTLENPDIQSLVLKFSDIEDGIKLIHNSQFTIRNEDAVYDVSGRRFDNSSQSSGAGGAKINNQNSKLPRGIYIIDGKKVIR
ncbi:MAG: phosphatidylinositol-specific phospholipase C [Bacteroidaceae bacterium]|nr:phosphatidylinositol-specific phospholipase C [Bacteroidaceae bacterium]